MIQQRLGQYLSGLKVGQKIGLGYALALGIAVSGTVAGFGVRNYYHNRAEVQQRRAYRETELLSRLHSRILQTQTHQQRLPQLQQNPAEFQEEHRHLLMYTADMQSTWAELETFAAQAPPRTQSLHQEELLALLQTYHQLPDRYAKDIKQHLNQIDNLNLSSPGEAQQAQRLLSELTQGDTAIAIDSLADVLVDLINDAYLELDKVDRSQQQMEQVAEKIVFVSVGLSVLSAILLASVISQAIAKPIEALTRVAQQSTEESNFDLKATIEQNDEIGQLARAFNTLTDSVRQLLQSQQLANQQLASYSQSLETEVEERNQLLQELRRTQFQMVQSEKMSALGQMVAGVAHEINNPVGFIHSNLVHVQEYIDNLIEFLQLYQDHYPDSNSELQAQAEELDIEFIQEDLPKMLSSMKMGTDRIRQIVLSLRNFSRLDEAEVKAVDIHEGIDSTLLILQHRLKDTSDHPAIQIIRDYGNLPRVECFPGQLNQVFMNVLANGIDALEEVNARRSYGEIQQNPSQITIRTATTAVDWVRITISDNGVGMSESIRQRIFDPFFTTKAIGKGTGMGMPISYQIITEKHDGKLDCYSKPGEGTEFVIQIPIHQKVSEGLGFLNSEMVVN